MEHLQEPLDNVHKSQLGSKHPEYARRFLFFLAFFGFLFVCLFFPLIFLHRVHFQSRQCHAVCTAPVRNSMHEIDICAHLSDLRTMFYDVLWRFTLFYPYTLIFVVLNCLLVFFLFGIRVTQKTQFQSMHLLGIITFVCLFVLYLKSQTQQPYRSLDTGKCCTHW